MYEHKIQFTQNMYRSMSTYFNSLAVVNSEKKVIYRSMKTYRYIILHMLHKLSGMLGTWNWIALPYSLRCHQ